MYAILAMRQARKTGGETLAHEQARCEGQRHFQKRKFTDIFHNMNYSFETEDFLGTFHWYN